MKQDRKGSNDQAKKHETGHTLWIFKFDPRKCDIFSQQIPNQKKSSLRQEPQNVNQIQQIQNNSMIRNSVDESQIQQPQFSSNAANKSRYSPQRQKNPVIEDKDSRKKRMRIKWDYRYNNLWEEYYSTVNKQNLDINFENKFGLKLFAFIGEFRLQAVQNVINIVNELIFPPKLRRYLEVKSNHPMYQFKNRNEKAYLVDGIFIRLAYIEIFSKESLELKKRGDSQMKNTIKDTMADTQENKQQTNQQTEIYRNLEVKMIAHEFRSNDIIADSIHQFIMNSEENDVFSLRVPLTCQVDYLGFTCLCSTVAPLLLPLKKKHNKSPNEDVLDKLIMAEKNANNLSLIHGLMRNGIYLEYESQKLINDLELLGNCLKLKPFQINGSRDKNSKQINIYISLLTEVHCLKNNDLIQSDIKNEVEGETRDKKQKRLKILHSKQKKSDKSDIQEHKKFYLMKTATTFPLEFDVQATNKKIDLFKNRLRPEYLSMIQCYLSNGAFLNSNNAINTDQDDLLLASACLKLNNEVIGLLVKDLEDMVIQPIGTEQLSQYFHFYGVNMRHLGKVASRSNLPHIKEICVTDMVARSSKKIFRANMAKFILNHSQLCQGYATEQGFKKLEQIFQRDIQAEQNKEIQYDREIVTIIDDLDINKGKHTVIDKRISDDKKPGKSGQKKENSDGENDDDEDEQDQLYIQQKYDSDAIYEEEHEFQQRFDRKIQDIKDDISSNFEKVIIEVYHDYLNLMFTQDAESLNFWNDQLIPQIQQDFNYTITYEQATNLSTGYLIHAISYHWRVSFDIIKSAKIKIFGNIPPSEYIYRTGAHVQSKVYQFRNLKINQVIQDYQKNINAGQYDEAITYMKIKKKIYELIYDKKLTPPAPHLEYDLAVDIVNTTLMKLDAKNKELQNQKLKKTSRYRSRSKRSYSNSPNMSSQPTSAVQKEQEEEKLLQEMIKEIKLILSVMPFKHAACIKPMRTLINIYTYINSFSKNNDVIESNIKDCMNQQNEMKEYIEYHLGHHPLTAELCAIESDYNFLVQDNDKALQSLSDAIKICKDILGGNHVKISELYQKQAYVYLKQKQNQKALQYFSLSKQIIESHSGPQSIEYGKICYEISKIYFSTSDLQQGIQLCKQAYQIFYQRGENYIMQSLNCCRQCCEAALNLKFPKEVIEYAEKMWDILKSFDKKLKKSQRISYLEFIFEALLRVIIYSLKPDERNYLLCVLLYCTTEKNPFRPNGGLDEKPSATNGSQSTIMDRQSSVQESSISQIESPEQRSRGKTSFDLNHDDSDQRDLTFNIFDEYKLRVQMLRLSDLNPDQLDRASLYPDNRIFNPQDVFEYFDSLNQSEIESKKKDLFEQLTKDVSVTSLEIVKNMFNDILSKKYTIPLKDFYINFKKYLEKNNDFEKLEQLELYKTFIEIYGYVFFYNQLNSPEFSKYRILDYDPK